MSKKPVRRQLSAPNPPRPSPVIVISPVEVFAIAARAEQIRRTKQAKAEKGEATHD
ncbi:MAG: hypothetical protein AB7P69_03785 [Candidatus Binatia bacterium]